MEQGKQNKDIFCGISYNHGSGRIKVTEQKGGIKCGRILKHTQTFPSRAEISK